MAELYVHAVNGSDSNAGTAIAPKLTISAAQTFLAANLTNSTVYLAGTFRNERFDVTGQTGCSIVQWEGQAQAWIRGDVLLATSGWTSAANNEWWIAVPAGITIIRVVEDWDTNVDADGRHQAHLSWLGGVVHGVGALSENEFAHDTGANRLYVRTFSNESPNTNGRLYGYCINTEGSQMTTASGCSIRGVNFALWMATSDFPFTNTGNGIDFSGSTSCSVVNCEFHDIGGAGVMFSGVTTTGGLVSNCTFVGGRGSQGQVTVYADTIAGRLSSTVIEDSTFITHVLFDRNGDQSDIIVTAYCHSIVGIAFDDAGNPGGLITDLLIRNCTFDCEGGSGFLATFADSPLVAAGDDATFSAYPYRFEDCVATGCNRLLSTQTVVGGSVAFRRCILQAPGMATGDAAVFTSALTTTRKLLLESCVVSVNSGSTAGTSILETTVGTPSAPIALTTLNCTLYDDSSTAAATKSLVILNTTGTWQSHQSILTQRSANAVCLVASGTLALTQMDHHDNWLVGHSTTAMSDNASLNTQAEWSANIDPTAIYTATPGFTTVPTNLEGTSGSNVRTLVSRVATHAEKGVNGQFYDGHYGAYQYGSGPPGTVAESLYALLTADTTAGSLAALLGRDAQGNWKIYHQLGPQNVSLPMLRYDIMPSPPARHFGGKISYGIEIHIDIFGSRALGTAGITAVSLIDQTLFDLLDGVELDVPGLDRGLVRFTARGQREIEEDAIRVSSTAEIQGTTTE